MVDDFIPEDYARACREALEGKRDKHTGRLHKETAWVQVPGSNFSIGRDENGNVTGQGTFSFTPESWAAFMRVAMTLPMGVEMPSTQGYGGVSSSAAMWDSNKRQDERNKEAYQEIERIKAFLRR